MNLPKRRNYDMKARAEGKDVGEVPPALWQRMTPDELPLDEVKAYLQLTSFQSQFIRDEFVLGTSFRCGILRVVVDFVFADGRTKLITGRGERRMFRRHVGTVHIDIFRTQVMDC